ncbi:hypothetical protein AURDEDRAFT_176802 [Auricularia subglabra TFB-10046 SS5]|uniref:Uncharacterized protein n=1 Tax=Auricularia subglabra (strain TFB-10046 / SS5) TaxID=717982 RepID=J0WQI5_AURST|nr:hypothetical protein AURDEDRAFT_176802 [Auricularia subglabra TFB-10046 SS5]
MLYPALADRLARTSLAATSSSSRVSAMVLVLSGDTPPGAGRPSRPYVPRRDIQLLALLRDGTGSVWRGSTRPWSADHLARTSLAATSSSSRSSAMVLVSSGEALPGAGRPSRSHVPPRDIQLLARVRDGRGSVWRCFAQPWYADHLAVHLSILHPGLADHLARTTLASQSALSLVFATALVASLDALFGPVHNADPALLAATFSSSRASAMALGSLPDPSPGGGTYHWSSILDLMVLRTQALDTSRRSPS